MKLKVWLLIISMILTVAGCASQVRLRKITPFESKKKGKVITEVKVPKVEEKDALRVGERLVYSVNWNFVPVGHATLSVQEITEINGRKVYHLLSTAKSNDFLSTFYKVDDNIHSWIDEEGLYSLRFEKHMQEGNYRAHEVMEYDYANKKAHYKSFTNKSEKTIDLPDYVKDQLSCIFFYRTMDIQIGKSNFIKVEADEQVGDVEVKALEYQNLVLPGLGSFDAVMVEPKANFRGIFVRKGRLWIWMSADKRRLPLMMKTQIPIGSVVCILERIEQN
ncbi:MAG: DUF3108 domain-containing protein [Candidatus Omnitrophica bacterium]|nr:DUF3108 domain-containing protein [Candidatus Omnitrophota bacterium]